MKTKEHFLKAFLAETPEEAEKVYAEFNLTLNSLAYSYSVSTGLEKADLFSEALVGLARAKRDFDKERSEDFKSYALVRIKDAMNNYVRRFSSAVVIPSYIKKAHSVLEKLKHCLLSSNLDIEAAEEILQKGENHKSCQKLLDSLHGYAERASISYEELYSRAVVLPTIMDELVDFGHEEVFSNTINEIKDKLTEEENTIVELLLEEKSLSEIGSILGRSASWVHTNIVVVRNKLKGYLYEHHESP